MLIPCVPCVRYGQDPVIMAWNLINEPRCYQCQAALQVWVNATHFEHNQNTTVVQLLLMSPRGCVQTLMHYHRARSHIFCCWHVGDKNNISQNMQGTAWYVHTSQAVPSGRRTLRPHGHTRSNIHCLNVVLCLSVHVAYNGDVDDDSSDDSSIF